MKWLTVGGLLLAVGGFALNVQWHYDRMCATVFSPGAVIRLDGVRCETALGLMDLDTLLERHERVQKQLECMAAYPGKEYLCDPRYIPPTDDGSG